jgi:Tol biopolymer transport system component
LRISALALALGLAFTCGTGGRAEASGAVDPALRFKTITTAHFVVYFHQGEERTGQRLAAIAEETWRALQQPLAVTPPARTHVVLVDQTEAANGSAFPVPYDTIYVTATWPAGSDFIGYTDDWLRLVFTHEYTHIVHLDRSEGWARWVRRIFGRVPLAFPNIFLPTWQVEGLAVYEESVVTGEGRLHAGDFRAIVESARREHALEPIDRVNGGLTDWPGGSGAYAYGAAFHQYLSDTYGADTLAALANRTARSVPYTSSRGFKDVYGTSLGALWRDFEAQPPEKPATTADDQATRITHHGFVVSGPRFAPPLCTGCASDIVYALNTPNAFPTLNAVAADGSHDRVLARRYEGSTSGTSRDAVVFDQQEYRRNIGLYSDLYVLERKTGAVRAITNEARLTDPDLSPDGTRIVCVRNGNGRRDLVVLRMPQNGNVGQPLVLRGHSPDTTVLASETETQFEAPRWSPDGRFIAVARHRLGGESEIIIVDAETRSVRVVASDAGTRFVTPTWRPDGLAVVAAADYDHGVFNLYEFDLRTSRPSVQLTHTAGGALWPDISADGHTIVFVGYTTEGFDLFRMPSPEQSSVGSRQSSVGQSSVGSQQSSVEQSSVEQSSVEQSSVGSYSPWTTVKPTSWMPYVDNAADQIRFGATVGGYDVLGYHGYSLSATWLVAGPQGAVTPGAATPDWEAAYAYARWRPTFFARAARTTTFYAGPPTDAGAPTNTTAREYQLEGGVELPFIHTRSWHVLYASLLRADDRYDFTEGTASVNRTALRTGWESSTAHVYGYSISPEGGVTLGGTVEATRRAWGSYADATTATADARAYIAGIGPHDVIAIRAAGGASSGSDITGRTFLSGGSAPAPPPLSFDSRALGLLRGFPPDTFAGSRIGVVNAEYRFPIARPQRGHGTFPLFLRAVHAALFGDAANAWTRTFRAGDVKTSAGMELSADVVAGYVLPFTASLGAGWGHDGSGRVSNARTIYLRLGRAF